MTTGGRGIGFDVAALLRFGDQRVQIVELGGVRLVTHLLGQDHRRFLVEHLVDRDHLAHLHQRLDDLGGLDRHLVRELGDGDRFRNRDFADDRAGEGAARPRRLPPRGGGAPTFGCRQPAVAAPPVTSPRSLSARRRAASSWNAVVLGAS